MARAPAQLCTHFFEEVIQNIAHPYKVNNQFVDYEFKLRHGASEKKFQVDKVSNAKFTDVSDSLVSFCG